ncbi:YcxB family protein [Croceicoccus naphthovorans]|nr:YcxB family protein [Croceicoccus naphthovorans]MBB3990131.1 hypothetical protein [Croceicoccus naphthovorans]
MKAILFGCIFAAVALVGMVMPSVRMMLFMWQPAFAIFFQQFEGLVYAFVTVIAYGFGTLWAWREHRRRFLGALYESGMPGRVEARFTVSDEAFIVDNGRMEYRVRWDAVAAIVSGPTCWMVQVDLQTFTIPKKAFASKDDERAFVAALLDHVRDFVRDGSKDAAAFVAETDQ